MLNGLPCWLSGKESVCNAGDPASIPWVRKIPWRRAWQPTPVFLPWESPWTEEPSSLQSMGSQSQTWLKPLGSNSAQQTLTVFISSQLWFPPPGSLDSNLFCTWVVDFYWLNFGHTIALSKKILRFHIMHLINWIISCKWNFLTLSTTPRIQPSPKVNSVMLPIHTTFCFTDALTYAVPGASDFPLLVPSLPEMLLLSINPVMKSFPSPLIYYFPFSKHSKHSIFNHFCLSHSIISYSFVNFFLSYHLPQSLYLFLQSYKLF